MSDTEAPAARLFTEMLRAQGEAAREMAGIFLPKAAETAPGGEDIAQWGEAAIKLQEMWLGFHRQQAIPEMPVPLFADPAQWIEPRHLLVPALHQAHPLARIGQQRNGHMRHRMLLMKIEPHRLQLEDRFAPVGDHRVARNRVHRLGHYLLDDGARRIPLHAQHLGKHIGGRRRIVVGHRR